MFVLCYFFNIDMYIFGHNKRTLLTKQSHYNVYTIIIILLFRRPMWSGQWPGPRPAGSGLGLKYEIVLRAGPGRAGPGRART